MSLRLGSRLLAGLLIAACVSPAVAARERWTDAEAKAWQQREPWLVGSNYAPAYAINQLEMWQADSFDIEAIDREMALAESLGFNSMRVFLHHLLWEQDREGFLKRMDQYLAAADKHGVGTMFVLFDSVWDPNPQLGPQRPPKQGLHNSGWVQSPGAKDLMDRSRHALLEDYVRGVVRHFKDDRRVQVWDLWNEPDNLNGNSYGEGNLKQEPAGKQEMVAELIAQSFTWAREENPTQPLTSGVWVHNRIGDPAKLIPVEKIQLAESDIVSYHSYGKPDEMADWVKHLRGYGRPLVCTEYMARPVGSTFDPVLGYLKKEGIGAYNWGFVAGKSNTIYPWDSWQKPYATEPPVWFHDIFRADGQPYRAEEVEYIRQITGRAK
ncbi:MAG: cellulase family glycosylhydrolase [Planctomycetia bacterium]|nr:cellulase family glycosylhydrolase [Planctomycetia bacterium]